MKGGQKGAWPIKGVATQGGGVIGSDIGWSMGGGSEGGVGHQGGVVIRSDLGAWSKRSCGQWGAGGAQKGAWPIKAAWLRRRGVLKGCQ